MASITPGSGGTFTATTAEGRAIETLTFMQVQEQSSSRNPSELNYVVGAFDSDDLMFSGSYTLPAALTISTDGSLKIAAIPYLQGVTFSPGTSSPTFKSTTIESYLLEVLMYLQGLEQQAAKNPQGLNYITGNFNSDTGLYQGSFTLPISLALAAAGKVEITAQEYLTT